MTRLETATLTITPEPGIWLSDAEPPEGSREVDALVSRDEAGAILVYWQRLEPARATLAEQVKAETGALITAHVSATDHSNMVATATALTYRLVSNPDMESSPEMVAAGEAFHTVLGWITSARVKGAAIRAEIEAAGTFEALLEIDMALPDPPLEAIAIADAATLAQSG